MKLLNKKTKLNIATLIAFIVIAIGAIIFISMALYDDNGVEIKAEVKSDFNLIKYVNYEVDEKESSILEFNLKEGVSYNTEYYSPVKENSVYLKMPAIEDKLPNRVEVISISSKATNGNIEQKDAAYEYNSNTGILHIWDSNQADENGDFIMVKVQIMMNII